MAAIGEQGNLLENKIDKNAYSANYDYSLTLDVPFGDGNKQLITMPAGYDYFHAMIRVGKYIFASTRDATTPRIVRFNDVNDLTNYTAVTLPYKTTQLTHIRGTNKIYMSYYPSDSLTNPVIRVGLIDAETLAFSTVITDNYVGFGTQTGPWGFTIATDESYLYVLSANGRSDILKYSLVNHSRVSVFTPPFYGRGHGLIYDGKYLYATSNQTVNSINGEPAVNYVMKVDPVTMTLVDSNTTFPADGASARTTFTDDFCCGGDYLYLPVDSNHLLATYTIVKVSKADLSNVEYITFPGVVGNSYGTWFDGRYVWVLFSTNPGKVGKIDTFTDELYVSDLPAGEQSPNELVYDGKRIFMSFFQAPAKFARYSVLPFNKVVQKMTSVIPLDFVDDTAAAAGGVAIGQIYHTAGSLKIRLI